MGFSSFYVFLCFNGVIIFESILSIKGVQLRIRLIKGISSFISFLCILRSIAHLG